MSKKRVKFWLLLYFSLYSYIIYAQNDNYFYIYVLDEQNNPVYDAVVTIDESVCCISNICGNAEVRSVTGKIKISISHISFETKDTSLDITANHMRITFRLKPSIFEIEEITIKPEAHITDDVPCYTSDLCMFQNLIFVLYTNTNKAFISFFDSSGYTLDYTYYFEQNGTFQSIAKGYSEGQYYLLGPKLCVPFTIQFSSNILAKEQPAITRIKYDELFGKVLLLKDSLIIKKEISEFGNKVDIYAYNTKKLNRSLVYQIYDKTKSDDAIRNFNKVKSIYLNSISNPKPNDIDYDFIKQDVTVNPNWSGDIMDLVVNNDQLPYISSFQAATKGLNVDSKTTVKYFFILDNVEDQILKVNLSSASVEDHIKLPESDTNFNFILSDLDICIEDGNNYYCMNKLSTEWNRLIIDEKKIFYPKRKILMGSNIFLLGRKFNNVVNNQIFMTRYKAN